MGPLQCIKIWFRVIRPDSFPVSIVPALLGISLAWSAGVAIRADLAVMTIIGALAIHTATNLLQEYCDYTSGIDRPGTLGGSGVLVQGQLSPRAVLAGSILFFGLSAVAAIPLIMAAGPWLVAIIAVGGIAGVGYALPGKGLKYRAMGDIAVFLAFGIGITLGSYLIQARSISAGVLAAAAAFGMLVAAVLHANNMRDRDDDLGLGIRTLAVRLGMQGSFRFFVFLIAGAYAIIVFAAAMRLLPAATLLTLLTLPLALSLLTRVKRAQGSDRAGMVVAWQRTAQLSLLFGITLIAGILGSRIY